MSLRLLGTRPVAAVTALQLILVGWLAGSSEAWAQAPSQRIVDVIEVSGVIDPPMASYIQDRLTNARAEGAHAAIIQLDTPGGLDVPMREIVQQMLDSDIPVIVWVAPRGARAASAGTFLTYAGHLSYMAEATVVGAATPINLGGQLSPALERKITNDAVEYIRGLAALRGRNQEWAEAAVREAASIGASRAEAIGVVDGIASTLRELLERVDGSRVDLAGSSGATLETWDESAGVPTATVRFQGMNLVDRLLHSVVSPEVAFLLLLVGAFGLIFEIYNPGIGLAGILGAVALLLGFYGLSVLPTNWLGVLLIVLAVVLLVVDLHTAGLGAFTVGGLATLVGGGLVLFAGAPEALALSPWSIVAAVAVTVLFFISVMTAALRVRLRRPIMGGEAMVGTVGEAKTDIAPEGTVLSRGTLWRARTMETGIAAGSRVQIKATEGLVLLVEPHHEDEAATASDPATRESEAGRTNEEGRGSWTLQ
jgi:membrane-bound serine protease (ClpP class)